VDVLGKLAPTKGFKFMAAQSPEVGGNYSIMPWLPTEFVVLPTDDQADAWILVNQGVNLLGSTIETLSPTFSGSGACSVSFSTSTGGYNGHFSGAFGVGQPCITITP